MVTEPIRSQLTDGTILEGPHWTEPVKVLTVKTRGSRIEIQAVGLHTKKLWTKLLRPEDFDGTIKVTAAGTLAALDGDPTQFRLAAEAHRIRLAFQYDPHFAVEVSMRHERDEGRNPVSVEQDNCGWDLTSLLESQVDRYIEVKGRAGVGGVALTPNEWIKAQRFGRDDWLYVVVNCQTNPELYSIQDPASKLSPKEDSSVVRYMVGQADWKQAADQSSHRDK